MPKPLGSGRTKGTPNKSTTEVGTFARRIVEDPAVQAVILRQARTGVLPAPVLQMLFHYAYGKPVEIRPDDEAFMHDLLTVVFHYVESREGQQAIRAVIDAHAGQDRLRLVERRTSGRP
jgi:hypothetical protein